MAKIASPMMGKNFPIVSSEIKEHATSFMIVGIVMIVLGFAAIAFPFIATLTIELLVGWIIAISGFIGIVHFIKASKWKGFQLSLLGSLLSLGVGVVLLIYPFTGILSLTLLIAAFFLAGGTFRIVLALRIRPLDHWIWLLISGILALLLGAVVLFQWPEIATWFIGMLVGIDLIFSGWTSILLSFAARRINA
jgi:uncharacterized membrane protein HdeD (DUF308 family)